MPGVLRVYKKNRSWHFFMHRRLLALATLGFSLSTFGLQAKAESAYIWGESQSNSIVNDVDYGAQEIFLLEVDLSTGNFTEVPNSRAVNLYNLDFMADEWSYTNEAGFFGTPRVESSTLIGNKIYFTGEKESNGGGREQRISYFDLDTNTYGLALSNGLPSGDQSPTDPSKIVGIPGDPSQIRTNFSNFIIQGQNTTAGSGTADLSAVSSQITENKQLINSNRKNINDLGDGIAASTALGAALSALPVTPDDAPFSCGVGSGAYSSRFAMGLGCVAKLNRRLSVNAGGSHVFGGSSDYGGGSLDTTAWRGGFVLKLGRLDSPADTNEQLQSEVKQLKQLNEELMSRLERLESIAHGQKPAINAVSLK